MPRRRTLLLATPALGGAAALPGCATSRDSFAAKGPPLRPEEFFAGRLRAHGLFATRLGAIERWYTATMTGAWDGRELTVDEIYRYDDSFEDRRFWTLRRDPLDPTGGTWLGEASDGAGPVRGQALGSGFHLTFGLNMLTLSGERRHFGFDQWFVRTAEDMAIGRADLSWWGLTVGTVQTALQRTSVGVTPGRVYAGQAAREEPRAVPGTTAVGTPAAPSGPPVRDPYPRDPGRLLNGPPRR